VVHLLGYAQIRFTKLLNWRITIVEITKETKVSDILENYGDIADVMELFGVKRVARYSFRRFLTKAISVETAARVHRVPLDEFLEKLKQAVAIQEQKQASEE
jgi:hypothetical protein